jgi:hypothetical protein
VDSDQALVRGESESLSLKLPDEVGKVSGKLDIHSAIGVALN